MQEGLPEVFEVLLSRGVPEPVLRTACLAAARDGMSPAEYLARHALVSTESLYSAFAECCGVPYLPDKGFRFQTVNDRPLTMSDGDCGPAVVSLYKSKAVYAIAPEISQFEAVQNHLRKHPDFALQIRIASPEGVRYATSILNSPSGELESRFPEFSAGRTRWPVAILLLLCAVIVSRALTEIDLGMLLVGITGLGTFACAFSGVARLVSVFLSSQDQLHYTLPEPLRTGHIAWPNYSVLVPLYKEAGIVPELVEALSQLNYPKDRLQILLLVEEGDRETREALSHRLPAHFRVIVAPHGHPQTKPRALSYGLAQATGEFITIYDAEDRPDPDQLKKAALFFSLSEDLACLQARIAIDNANESFVSRQFALEYACLFDQLLPWFGRNRWPFPLGGTSNHFRKSALDAAGGWDKYNVTEDADLGVRLERMGFRIGILTSDTREEAPISVKAWLAQRARWHKGWMQTIAVHGRHPVRLVRDLGIMRSSVLAGLFLGTFLLIALHPVFFLMLVSYVAGLQSGPFAFYQNPVLLTALIGMAGIGYFGALIALVVGGLRRGYGIRISDPLGVLVYWMLSGAAFYRALWGFMFNPHHWNKTEHGVSKTRQRVASRPPPEG
ncbi:glycosyltransferase [Roseibium denhamense]|uniref:Glycosyltransferase, catalytic subunit of cellulose synthase and poly-beta-1,6-N-acetylglucosamine synthase n=1 Tax=Roseibium denhamense TaxID=76305 RepID=A0ABY1P4H9_9HYPH|nr:glycosyltransferase [Roseibium denhamense]MTI07271.1 glycosyltransferase [Roseibium denhamense]SMP26184.1 Glycosyltransferase, catalytic subunit of cellulose synthase and poly-beta-1,6-N-acetylglucosamine synthase [Roseibium denhamense]